ncbi:hypothetical protein [Streptomyces sp. NPDC046727]|uniref:hypothetical protein n=1 Tax=Streptomyces sp. NPDC046727 TaxID=3155373 RepID=UPI0033D5C96A
MADLHHVHLAQDRAAEPANGAAFAKDFTATWQRVDRLCRVQPAGRAIWTRHGDAMLLSEFLLTLVVEVAVRGLDLADALGREPWLTSSAGDAVLELLLGAEQMAAADKLGWSQPHFMRKATGREPLDETEAAQIEQLGIRWLARNDCCRHLASAGRQQDAPKLGRLWAVRGRSTVAKDDKRRSPGARTHYF